VIMSNNVASARKKVMNITSHAAGESADSVI